MAYTPINWQTGDTITAEKMNKMDNGWGTVTTQQAYFDGTVTTSGERNEGYFTADAQFDASTIIVTFNGDEYECKNIGDDTHPEYGATFNTSSMSIDFTTFPFNVFCSTGANYILTTETAGTYSIKIEVPEKKTEVSDAFKEAVDLCVDVPRILKCVEGVTTIEEVKAFLNDGGIVYFTAPKTETSVQKLLFFINEPSLTCTIFPSSTTLSAEFGRDDGLFNITYL